MKTAFIVSGLGMLLGLMRCSLEAQPYVTPKLGGGQVAADMVHIDIYYDAGANVLHAHVDDSYGTPELLALAPDQTFDPQAAYAGLNGKAYNAQYGWNAGGFFTLPAGAAIWIEQTAVSAGLEVYEGWGRLGTYSPIFGTAGSPTLWKWSGVMVHNTYAVWRPTVPRYVAEYHIFFGDATTGSRVGFAQYDDVTVRLEWTTAPVEDPFTFKFGATGSNLGAPLSFLNAESFATNAQFVLPLPAAEAGTFSGPWSLMAVPASGANGGPVTNHAALGACVELELQSLTGPPGAALAIWGTNDFEPICRLPVGTSHGTHRLRLSDAGGVPGTDPYGYVTQRLSANQPGLYCLGFQLVDQSTNGPGSSPLHSRSEAYCIYLQAGLSLTALENTGSGMTSVVGGEPGREYFLERTSILNGNGDWETVAGPVSGTNQLLRLSDPHPTGPQSFYRVRARSLP